MKKNLQFSDLWTWTKRASAHLCFSSVKLLVFKASYCTSGAKIHQHTVARVQQMVHHKGPTASVGSAKEGLTAYCSYVPTVWQVMHYLLYL